MVPVSYPCSFLSRNLVALRAELLMKPVGNVLHNNPLGVSDESVVGRVRSSDSLQMDLSDVTNVNNPSAVRADLLLGPVEETDQEIR